MERHFQHVGDQVAKKAYARRSADDLVNQVAPGRHETERPPSPRVCERIVSTA